MKGKIHFADRPDEEILQHIGFEMAGLFVTESGTYMQVDRDIYRYLRESDTFVSANDVVKIEVEEK